MSTACNNNVSPPSAQDSNDSSIMPAVRSPGIDGGQREQSVSLDHAEASTLKSHAQVEYHDVRCRSSQGDHESEKSMNVREASLLRAYSTFPRLRPLSQPRTQPPQVDIRGPG